MHIDPDAINARLADLAQVRPCKKCKVPLAQAITDITDLLIQVTGMYAVLIETRLEAANLRAAIYAALSAADDGEPDPLAYLRDEFPDYTHVPARDTDRGWRA